jgi:hypothetical protein
MLMVTTILFNKVPSSYIAGAIANDMFAAVNLFGMFSSGFLLIYGFRKENLSFIIIKYDDEVDFIKSSNLDLTNSLIISRFLKVNRAFMDSTEIVIDLIDSKIISQKW